MERDSLLGDGSVMVDVTSSLLNAEKSARLTRCDGVRSAY